MVFFSNAEERIYGRYGGRDAKGPDTRMSLAGLHHAMEAALDTHAREAKEAPPRREAPKYIRDVATRRRGCFHCHQVKEALDAELKRAGKWSRDLVWRYPLPDNLGLVLEVDRGNVVRRVEPGSPAARAGLRAGDVVRRLNGVPVHSFADAQYALDRAPKVGAIEASWRRGPETMDGELTLPQGWRKTDISWRPSLQRLVPSPRLSGRDLPAKEKEALGLSAKQLAFRLEGYVHSQARDAGIRAGDVILGVDGKKLEMDATEFQWYVQRNYLVGDRVTVNALRDGKRLSLTMTFR
jgi:S1-C subfamily serine protease